jgi:GT2 family glycosyltransferase
MKNIAIIVLNWKQPQLTVDTVESLLKINHKKFNFKIIVIDNGSTDDSVEMFRKKYQKNELIKILDTQKNLGYVGGNNFGIKYALKHNYDYVLLLNNDVIVDNDFLTNLLKPALKNNSFGILGPKIYFAPGHEFHKDRYSKDEVGNVIWAVGGQMDWNNILGSNIGVDEVDHGQFEKMTTDLDFISGCCMLVRKEVFEKIGLLDQDYFMYLEDVDFCQRAKKAGYKLTYIPSSKIWHINAGSSKSGGDLHDYFITRNRLIFSQRFARLRTKFAVFRESIKTLFTSKSQWKRQAVIDFYLHKFEKGSWL